MRFLKIIFFLTLLAAQSASAGDTTVVSAGMFDKFSDRLRLTKKNEWFFRPGNDTNWARPDIDTSGWIKINLADLKNYADKNGRVEGWFRMKVKFDSSLSGKKLWIVLPVWAATELFINGRLTVKGGNIGNNEKSFSAYNGDLDPLSVTFKDDSVYTFAVHFAGYLSPFTHSLKYQSRSNNLLTIVGPNPHINTMKLDTLDNSFSYTWLAVCAVLSVLFWLLAFQNRREKTLIWVAVCTSIFTLINFSQIKMSEIGIHFGTYNIYDTFGFFIPVTVLVLIFIPLLMVRIFKRKLSRKLILFLVTISLFYILVHLFNITKLFSIALIFASSSALGVCLYYIISSWKKLRGAQWAIVVGLFFCLFSLCGGVIFDVIVGSSNPYFPYLLLSFFILSLPLSLLVYVSMRFKEMMREVSENADKVVQLSEEKRAQAENQQKVLQEEVNKQTAEIRNTLDNLKATQSQLIQSEKMASLGELTAGIAHEIQNPLNFVNNFSEVNTEMVDEAREEVDKGNLVEVKNILDDIKNNSEKINHHGKRADAIVKSMLEHSRTSTGIKEPTDINKLADEYLRLSYHGLRAKDKNFNSEIKTDFDETVGKINIIPQDIGRVLLNLFNNAFYAVSQQKSKNSVSYQPTVSVSTKKEGDRVTITVKDNGGGIPENIKEKIFQPFFTTKPTGSGTGLGLSLSYDIVKAHGGEIKVETKEGEGSEFIIQLPKT